MNITEFRIKYPQYNDLSDVDLAHKLHAKDYADMPFENFAARFGITQVPVVSEKVRQVGTPWMPMTKKIQPDTGERGSLAETGAAHIRGWLDLGKTAVETSAKFSPLWGKYGIRGALERRKPEEEQQLISPILTEAAKRIESAREKFPQTKEGLWGWALNILGEGAPQLMASIATGGQSRAVPFMIGFTTGGEQAYEKAKKRGASEIAALRDYALTGLTTGGLEMWGISSILKSKIIGKASLIALVESIKKNLWKQAGKDLANIGRVSFRTALIEGGEEWSQKLAEQGIEFLPGGADVPRTPDGKVDWKTMVKEREESLAGGALLGAVVPSVMNIPVGVEVAADPTVEVVESLAKEVQENPELGEIEKARLVSDLRELLPEVHEARKVRQFPPGTSNVYRGKESGKVYPETPEGGLTKMVQVEKPVEEVAAPEAKPAEKIISPFEFQHQNQENIIHQEWNAASVRYDFEGAGDIFRELSKKNPALSYLDEKISRVRRLIEATKRGRIHPDDSIDKALKEDSEKIKSLKELWNKQPVTNRLQELARDMNLALLSKDVEKAGSLLNAIEVETESALSNKITPELAKGEKVRIKPEIETKIIAIDTGEELELDKELSTQAVEESKRPLSIFDIPEATQQTLDAAKKLAGELTEIETQRTELAEKISKKRGITWKVEEAIIKKFAPEHGHIFARRVAMSKAKQLLRDVVPELTEIISDEEHESLQRAINETKWLHGGEKDKLSRALFEITKLGVQPNKSSIRLFDQFFGTNILKTAAQRKPKGIWGNIKYWANEILSIPVAIMTSAEQSFGLIQGFPMLVIQPKTWAKGIGAGARATLSDKFLRLAEIKTKLHPLYNDVVNRGGLTLTEIGEHYRTEEEFRAQLAKRIPIIGKIVAASERGHITAMNQMRSQYVYNWLELLDGQDISDTQLRQLCDHAGNITGRAKGKKRGWFEKHMDIWSILTWAPRLYGSWFKTLSDPIFKSGEMRKVAAHDLARIAAMVSTALFLASIVYPEDEFEQNPLSPEFGKIKSKDGTRRIDLPIGPAGQLIRFVSQIVAGKAKSASTGRTYRKPRLDILTRFLRGKQSWSGGIITDVITGKTFLGKQFDYTDPAFMSKYVTEHFTPMFYQDIVDAIHFQGLDRVSPFQVTYGMWGGGVQSYENSPKKEEMTFKNQLAHEYFGTDWDNLGEAAQTVLRKSRPMIEEFERATKFEQEDVSYRGWMAQESLNAGKRVEKQLSRKVRNEMERLQIQIGELKRYGGHGWYLNEKRYEQFQNRLAEHLKKVTDQIINSPGWENRHPTYQTTALEQVISELKRLTWKEIVAQANVEDFKRKEDLLNEGTTVAAK